MSVIYKVFAEPLDMAKYCEALYTKPDGCG